MATTNHTNLTRFTTTVAILLTISTVGITVSAQPSLAIIEITLDGELDPSVVDAVALAVEEGIREGTQTVLRPEVVAERLLQAGMDTSCNDEACLIEVGALTHSDSLLRVRVSGTNQSYSVGAQLLLGRDATSLGEAETSCDVCTWTEALSMIEENTRELEEDLPGFILLSVEPAEATLILDGDHLPSSVSRYALPPGDHHIEAAFDGYSTTQDFELESGEELELDLSFGPSNDRPWWRSQNVWGWIVGGVGVLSLIPGVTLLAINGNCRQEVTGPAEGCTEYYDSWPSGLALSLISGALITTSIVLLVRHFIRPRSTVTRESRGRLRAPERMEMTLAPLL